MQGVEGILNLAIALVGHLRGGPEKFFASGLTGMVSGSSFKCCNYWDVYNTCYEKNWFQQPKQVLFEVAASVNGQIMPPIMGAATRHIIAEMLGITYFQVITHALIPAVIVYLSLFWISHLEASKLGQRDG